MNPVKKKVHRQAQAQVWIQQDPDQICNRVHIQVYHQVWFQVYNQIRNQVLSQVRDKVQ